MLASINNSVALFNNVLLKFLRHSEPGGSTSSTADLLKFSDVRFPDLAQYLVAESYRKQLSASIPVFRKRKFVPHFYLRNRTNSAHVAR